MRRMVLIAGMIALLASGSQAANSFAKGGSGLGPLIGFGRYDLLLGGQYEYGVSPYVGIGAIAGFSSQPDGYNWGDVRYTYVSLGFQCNYHFRQITQFDLFAGGVLGYDIVSHSVSYHSGYNSSYHAGWNASSSRLLLGAQAGANFPIGRRTDIQARLGYPFGLSAGVNFRF